MTAILLLLLHAPARAADVFGDVDDEVTIGMGGTWARVFPTTDGFWFGQGAGGDFWIEDIGVDLSGYDDQKRIKLTEHAGLQDTQTERCDDGGWLVVGSATLDTFDDSAYAWRSDNDNKRGPTVVIEEREDARAHNDMAVLCTRGNEGVAFQNTLGGGGSSFFPISGNAVGSPKAAAFNAQGAAFAIRPSDGKVVGADTANSASKKIRFTVFAADWSAADTFEADVPQDYASWPQRLLPYGDGWLVVYVTTPSQMAMGGEGVVWVLALDADFQTVDSVKVTPEGQIGGRPWIGRNGDVLAVAYDRDVQPRITLIKLGADTVPDDDDIPDTADDGDTDCCKEDDTDVSDEDRPCCKDAGVLDCGCSSGASAGGAAFLGLVSVALATRRRRTG
ncbi:MAG: hypothetical protein EXR71_02380 [Myxococcales bacterium]|nr:hypothetical protein [Myxococcales bacterium]